MATLDRTFQPTPTDGHPSPTSILQSATEHILKARYLSTVLATSSTSPSATTSTPNASTTPFVPTLRKNDHIHYLLRNLRQGFPASYLSQSASQPWLVFWTLQAFSVLGLGLDGDTKKQAIETLLPMQHPDGGFGGGPGQAPHLLSTYSAVSALAIVGQPGEGGGWDQIDRDAMYRFFMSLKQPDGSFLVAHHAEVDVRGIYCLLAIATLLNILTPELLVGTPEFIASCQTYEGGFGNASFPGWASSHSTSSSSTPSTTITIDPTIPRPPLGEAHGGYTFCATASWTFLQPYLRSSPTYTSHPQPTVNLKSLLRWTVNMQGTEVELGGFKGRTNKLVDGCYSWWVGGCVGLVEGLMGVEYVGNESGEKKSEKNGDGQEHEWDDIDDSLFDRIALQEYVIYAAQHRAGGLVDKPPKHPDAYHTLYCLAGLSAAQHRVTISPDRKSRLNSAWKDDTSVEHGDLKKEAFLSALSWAEEIGSSEYVGGEKNRLNATHPLFNLTVTHTEGIMGHFYKQTIPSRFVHQPRT